MQSWFEFVRERWQTSPNHSQQNWESGKTLYPHGKPNLAFSSEH
jgi:hypothetical protein